MISLGIFEIFTKKVGVGIAFMGLIAMGFILTMDGFSFATKVIASIFGLIVCLFGLLLETPLLSHLKGGNQVPEFDN